MIPERIDGYLSRTAQRIDPKALVVVTELPPGTPVSSSEAMSIFAPEVWVLRRPGHPDMRLGTRTPTSFGDALDALRSWVAAQKAQTCRNCGSDPHTPTCTIGDPVGKARS